MIYSMTGFGKAVNQLSNKKIIVEIKSLNSKSLDLNVRLPQVYREKELELRKLLSDSLQRGKIDYSLYIENVIEQNNTTLNPPIVKDYIRQMKDILPDADETELMKMAVRMPDALKTEKAEIDETEWQEIIKTTSEALVHINEFRASEGAHLQADMTNNVEAIRQKLNEISSLKDERTKAVKERLMNGLEELKQTVDETRFAQEIVFYIEKLDINEEEVRLNKHLDYFTETLNDNQANGRKLGFISQEMGREINTIGSKSNHAAMQKLVVQMKEELEKIKEQVLNIL
ncbi:YicC/YloC family endoribonuclease [Avrilella dinanensis]|uniref:YicC/YloC family endoribonuclease n=1 Tax=Avrilella dinanensis TaxID=2008672 RepID=UPI00240A71FD|nr:YicC/YloC family endoribonuclease [Avrilella dinanensis]